jgi:hypothetical protein
MARSLETGNLKSIEKVYNFAVLEVKDWERKIVQFCDTAFEFQKLQHSESK